MTRTVEIDPAELDELLAECRTADADAERDHALAEEVDR